MDTLSVERLSIEAPSVCIPEVSEGHGEEVISRVKQSLEAEIEAVGKRTQKDLHAVLEACVSTITPTQVFSIMTAGLQIEVRCWAMQSGVSEQLCAQLDTLEQAVENQSKKLKEGNEGTHPAAARSRSPRPPRLDDRRRPGRADHLTIGADLVMEMCRKQLLSQESGHAESERLLSRVPVTATTLMILDARESSK